MFKLKDAYHCSVLVAKALDFESRSSYVLNITASNVSLLLKLLNDLKNYSKWLFNIFIYLLFLVGGGVKGRHFGTMSCVQKLCFVSKYTRHHHHYHGDTDKTLMWCIHSHCLFFSWLRWSLHCLKAMHDLLSKSNDNIGCSYHGIISVILAYLYLYL